MPRKLVTVEPTDRKILKAIDKLGHDAYLLRIVERLMKKSRALVDPGVVFLRIKSLKRKGLVRDAYPRIGIHAKMPTKVLKVTEKGRGLLS